MNYKAMEENAVEKKIKMPSLPATGEVKKGTRIILRQINKFRNRRVNVYDIRRKFHVGFL